MPALTREIAQPSAIVTHRAAVAGVDNSIPAAGDFCANPGDSRKARLWAAISFAGGSSPTIDLTPYFKPHGADAPIGQGEPVEYGGSDGLPAGTYVVDVDVEGSDLFCYLDNVGGSPAAFEISVYVQWL